MLKRVRKAISSVAGARVAIVASEYNRKHVDALLDAAARVLRDAGAEVGIFRVPGAFEIPVVTETIAAQTRRAWSAIICLGVIIRGETAHADLIATAITGALMNTSVRRRIPVVHEVLLVANRAQADARCLEPRFSRGGEAAQTALAMVRLMGRLEGATGRTARGARVSSNGPPDGV
jgi:6,7-dimethyl-8-ribityllumazine synthase